MLIQKAQTHLPWIALALCAAVVMTFVLTRPARETYDQCMARMAHPEQSEDETAAAKRTCASRSRDVHDVIGK